MMQPISNEKKQRILELYLNGNDKRLHFIASIVGSNGTAVSNIIQDFFDKKLFFERGDFQVLHSSINYTNNSEFNRISSKS